VILPGQRLPIVVAMRPVDFRRGHDGLAATVQNELGLDPHSGLASLKPGIDRVTNGVEPGLPRASPPWPR
jgi:hypothetical protein